MERDKIVSGHTAPSLLLPELADIGNGSLAMFGGLACNFETLVKYFVSHTADIAYGYYDSLYMKLGELIKTYGCLLLNDLWVLEIVKSNRDQYPNLEVSWRRLTNENRSRPGTRPTGRISHSLIMVDSKLFVAGGTTSVFSSPEWDNVCSTELWYFDLIKLKWYKVLDSGIEKTGVLHPGRLCRLRARAFGDKIVAVAQNKTDNFDEYACQYELQPERVVSFSLSESKWTVQSDNIPFAADNLYSWRGKVCS